MSLTKSDLKSKQRREYFCHKMYIIKVIFHESWLILGNNKSSFFLTSTKYKLNMSKYIDEKIKMMFQYVNQNNMIIS